MNKMLESFISESRDNLEEASQCFLALERNPDDDTTMQNLFRAMHTIKGSSGLFELGPFTSLMHVAEDILDLSRGGQLSLTSSHIDILLDAMDQITAWIDELEATGELSSDAEQIAQPHIAALEAIRPTSSDTGTAQESSKTTPVNEQSLENLSEHVTNLPEADRYRVFTEHDSAVMVHYVPKQDCFFAGDDPLFTARNTPACEHLAMSALMPWNELCELDPYQCNLQFTILSTADLEAVLDHYRYVEDDITYAEIDLSDLVIPTGEWSDDTSLFQDLEPLLAEAIENQNWSDISNLLGPSLSLANPDTYQASCLRWMCAVSQKDAAEPELMEQLHRAYLTGEFESCAPANPMPIDSEVSDSEANEPEQATGSEQATLNTSTALTDVHITLLNAQIQMLDHATDSDAASRVQSVAHILGNILKESSLLASLEDISATSNPESLIQFINQVIQNEPALEGVPEELDSTPDPNDELDMAAIVRQEQSQRSDDTLALETEDKPQHVSEALVSQAPSQRQSEVTQAPTKTEKAETQKPPQVLKVDQQRIDLLMDLVGELVVAKNSLPYLAKKAEDEFNVRALAKEIKSQYAVINRLAEAMQSTMMQIRMVPVSTIFQRFPRLVRDLSRKLNKDIQLVLEGEQSEADKNVVENLADPLIHLVRNSLDHGFETADERQSTGKPSQGTLCLRAIPKDDQVIIEVSDDGRGMDPQKLKYSAYNKGIIDEAKLESMTDQEALYLIFAPGFSTAEQVSDLSGRGVGMDVVNGLIQQAGGRVTIQSELGKGTTIRLFLPLTMAVSRVMMIEVQEQCFGISMENIVETVKVPHSRLKRIKQGEAIILRDKVIPVISLHDLLGLPYVEPLEECPLLIMNLNGEDVALKVDQFHEGIDIVQKPLAGLMAQYNYYAGSALLGDGRVLLILNIKELLSCQ